MEYKVQYRMISSKWRSIRRAPGLYGGAEVHCHNAEQEKTEKDPIKGGIEDNNCEIGLPERWGYSDARHLVPMNKTGWN